MTTPQYLVAANSTQSAILNRMLAIMAAAGYDPTEGEFAWDFNSPASIELAQMGIALRMALDWGFAETSFGAYLERRAAERGVIRLEATKATGVVRFTAPTGTLIPAGTAVSTVATATTPPQTFTTDVAGTVPTAQTTIDLNVTAANEGVGGNIPIGAIRLLLTAVAGVTNVTNIAAFAGGTDDEDDASLLSRYLTAARSSSAGGNRADYIRWSTEVAGVGASNVSYPGEGTPAVQDGGVRLSIVGSNMQPASLATQNAVLEHIVAPRRLGPYEAETFTVSGFGVTTDAASVDDSGNSMLMSYNASGNGQITHLLLHQQLTQPGIWMLKVRAKASAAAATAFFRIGVWNVTTGAWAKKSYSSSVDAMTDFTATQVGLAFQDATYDLDWLSQDFYWNGSDALETRIIRLTADTVRTVRVDQVRYRSVFASAVADALAPAGHRVFVQSAVSVSINVTAVLVITTGYTASSVQSQVTARIDEYLKSLAFGVQNDVQYARIGTTILDTPGVTDYSGLTVNGGTANIAISSEQVAVLGTTTLT